MNRPEPRLSIALPESKAMELVGEAMSVNFLFRPTVAIVGASRDRKSGQCSSLKCSVDISQQSVPATTKLSKSPVFPLSLKRRPTSSGSIALQRCAIENSIQLQESEDFPQQFIEYTDKPFSKGRHTQCEVREWLRKRCL